MSLDAKTNRHRHRRHQSHSHRLSAVTSQPKSPSAQPTLIQRSPRQRIKNLLE